jgi:2-methylisocitrate lyase-like PEP mutase family enzyme
VTGLKALIEAPEILVLPGVFDGFSLRLVESAGYNAAFVTGAGLAESRLGVPDIGLMGLVENLEGVAALVRRTSMRILADADTGYGNAVNVYDTVRRFERLGVAGVMLEDQVWPKRCGHMEGKSVIAAEEMVEKVHAAVDARIDSGFVIKARTDAAATHGIDDAVRRANLYAAAGADLVFADALLSADDIAYFAASVDAPVAVNMGLGLRRRATTPLISPRTLERMGVAVVIYPRMLTTAAVRGMQRALEAFDHSLASDAVVEAPDLQVSFEFVNELMDLPGFRDQETRYKEPTR